MLFLLLLLMSSDWFLLSLAQTNRRRLLLLLLLLNFSLPGLAFEPVGKLQRHPVPRRAKCFNSLISNWNYKPVFTESERERGNRERGREGIWRGGTYRAVIAALPAMKFIFQFHLLHSYYTSVMLPSSLFCSLLLCPSLFSSVPPHAGSINLSTGLFSICHIKNMLLATVEERSRYQQQ